MNFKQCKATNCGGKRTQSIKYIVIHYTANNGDTASGNANYFANNTVKASAHYFVDENEIWQSVKEDVVAWHCGGGLQGSGGHSFYGQCTNGNSIGIELCSRKNADGTYYFKDGTVENAIRLVRQLMAKYNIPASRVIRHYDVTGKMCPMPFVNADRWAKFKKQLEAIEVEKQKKIKLNGKEKTVHVIEKDGYNYIKLQDLRDDKIEIGYDGVPVVEVK